jgi:hypothetical protein
LFLGALSGGVKAVSAPPSCVSPSEDVVLPGLEPYARKK